MRVLTMQARARPSATWQLPHFAAASDIVQPWRKKVGVGDTVAEGGTQCQRGLMHVNFIANRQTAFRRINGTITSIAMELGAFLAETGDEAEVTLPRDTLNSQRSRGVLSRG